MGEADDKNEKGEQGDKRGFSGAALAAPFIDVEECHGYDQEGRGDDAVGYSMKPKESGREIFGLGRESLGAG